MCIVYEDSTKKDQFDVTTDHQGPALNVSITKKSSSGAVDMVTNGDGDDPKILDVDFTFALYCPQFPRDGKCKNNFYFILVYRKSGNSFFYNDN